MKTYTCAMCGEAFNEGWTDEEAMAESVAVFGKLRPEELDVVCDDCYQKINPAYHPHQVETAVADTLRQRLQSNGERTGEE